MNAIVLFTAGIEAMTRGAQLLDVIGNLNAVGSRMKAENRTDPTDEELDRVRGRIQARQERIERA